VVTQYEMWLGLGYADRKRREKSVGSLQVTERKVGLK